MRSFRAPRCLALLAAGACLPGLVACGAEERPPIVGALPWAPPPLEDATVVRVTAETTTVRLEPGRDYILELPDEPLEIDGGLHVDGGRNVVLIGGRIDVRRTGDEPVRGLYLTGATGTVHVEGVEVDGELDDGIVLNVPDAVVQLQNVTVGTVTGARDGFHADVVQTWAGPRELRIDGLLAGSTYQGLFLTPSQRYDGPLPDAFDIRRVHLRGTAASAYLLWLEPPEGFPVHVSDVWVEREGEPGTPTTTSRDSIVWPRPSSGVDPWTAAVVGSPPAGAVVTGAGVDYSTPGYATNR